TLLTGGGFLTHIVGYNINRIDLENVAFISAALVFGNALFVSALVGLVPVLGRLAGLGLAGLGLARLGLGRGRAVPAPPAIPAMAALFLMGTLALAPLVLKSGAAINYFIEWSFAIALGAMLGLAQLAAGRSTRGPAVAAALALLLCGHLWLLPRDTGGALDDRSALAAAIAAADRPTVSDEMVTQLRAGDEVIFESAIFGELAALGAWDPAPMVARIAARDFALFVTIGDESVAIFNRRWPPEIREALRTHYPVRRSLGRYVLHFPNDAAARTAMDR
ncbi:MAG: hypothetical protein AAF677_09505, partial [Pseudomonadota bacterium]